MVFHNEELGLKHLVLNKTEINFLVNQKYYDLLIINSYPLSGQCNKNVVKVR